MYRFSGRAWVACLPVADPRPAVNKGPQQSPQTDRLSLREIQGKTFSLAGTLHGTPACANRNGVFRFRYGTYVDWERHGSGICACSGALTKTSLRGADGRYRCHRGEIPDRDRPLEIGDGDLPIPLDHPIWCLPERPSPPWPPRRRTRRPLRAATTAWRPRRLRAAWRSRIRD
jgi:hypothetical protein